MPSQLPLPKPRPSIPELIEFHRLRDLERIPAYVNSDIFLPLLKQRISILIVTDSITFGDADFGLSMMIAALEENFSSSVYFSVKKATREGSFSFNPSPAASEPHYRGFRFNSVLDGGLVIDRFDQIWCFGLRPGNGAFNDLEVTSDPLYTTDEELVELARWMDERKGGIFATGDHAHLGASMCHRIPRVRMMRKWLMADNPPAFTGYDRFDTNRPRNPGDAIIPNDNQTDATPQPIEWLPEYWRRVNVFKLEKAPHPILCAGSLGPINVFPDHQHEGQIVEDDQVVLTHDIVYNVAGRTVNLGPEYPQTRATQTRPKIIARAHTLSDPPYAFGKGPTPARDFGLVGVYDGLREGVGRVVVDSTWHHQLNINLRDLAADVSSNHYTLIKTYYRNVGLWLANRRSRFYLFRNAVWNSFYTYQATQELAPVGTVFEIGRNLKDIVKYLLPPCLVSEFILDFVPPELVERFSPKFPIGPDPCLTCPPLELFENAILGGIVLMLHPIFVETERASLKEDRKQFEPDVKSISFAIADGIEKGMAIAKDFYATELRQGEKMLSILEEFQPPSLLREDLF